MTEPSTPTVIERQHLRGADGSMYRNTAGTIVINPAPHNRRHGAQFGVRRNANQAVVERLVAKGWLTETPTRFEVTPAGRAALDGA